MTETATRSSSTATTPAPPRGRRAELVCAWCGIVGLAIALVGFSLARFFPVPPKANQSSAEVVHFYTAHLTSFVPALMAYFFKSGPFAWHGIFVFYFGVAFYGLWLGVMSLELVKSVNRHYAAA